MKKLSNLMKELNNYNIITSIHYDKSKDKFYLDLNTASKSELRLYENGDLNGRYGYCEYIDFDDLILTRLSKEYKYSKHNRDYGNSAWEELYKQLWIK